MTRTEAKLEIRPSDRDFCAVNGYTPEQALALCQANSTECFEILLEDNIIAYWGYVNEPFIKGGVRVWMLATIHIEDNPIAAAKLGKYFLNKLLDEHGTVRALVDPGSHKNVRWLEFLGFKKGSIVDCWVEMFVTKGGRC